MKLKALNLKWVVWIAFTAITAVMAVMLILHLTSHPSTLGQYRWRWIAAGPIIALVPNIALLAMLFKSSSRKGALMWFTLMVLCNIGWLLVIVMCFIADMPEQAVFWYNMSGMFWIPLPVFMIFFALSYVSDNDLPPSLSLGVVGIISIPILTFITGASDLMNVRASDQTELYFWGYEAPPVYTQLIVIAGAFVLTLTTLGMLIKAYRRTIHEKRRRQIRLFIFGITQYMVLAIALDSVLPIMFEKPPIPTMTWFYSSMLALIIGYGIIRYGIFRISPASLSGTILESLSEAVLGVDDKLRVEFSNSGAEMIFGYDQDGLRGESIAKLFAQNEFATVNRQIDKGLQYIEFDDIEVLNKDGKKVPVAMSINKIFDERDKFTGYILVAANITELKKRTIELAKEKASVEQKVRDRTKELKEVHARLAASIDSLRLGFIMTNDRDELLLINPAAKEILAVFASENDIQLNSEDWNMSAVGKVFGSALDIGAQIKQSRVNASPLEFREIQLGDRYMHLFMSSVIDQGSVIGTVILFNDITEEKIIARSKEEFFSIASHELRTPLVFIQGSAELIHDYHKQSISSEEVIKMIGDIEKSSARLTEIVNDFLTMSELEQGKMMLSPSVFDIVKEIREIADKQKQREASNKPVELEINSSVETLEINGDLDKTRYVIRTFVSNAFKFTDEGRVTITVEPTESSVKVVVSDTGKGIKAENEKLLFRKFQQAGSSLLSRDGGGTGLGLYIVKMLLEVMGGSAKLESTEPDKGSSFSFTLPRSGQIDR